MMNYVIILLCGSSLISQSSSSWSFIPSVGLLHFILGLTCLSKYFGQAITLPYSTPEKHCKIF